MNPWVANYGRDRLTYKAETSHLSANYNAKYEGSLAHGYPMTSWLQLGLLYGCGIYTAQEQGVIKPTQFIARFWRHHYFDWMTFARRGFLFAGVGGLALGTVMFGNSNISLRRGIHHFKFWFVGDKPDNDGTMLNYFIKDN